MNMRSTLPGPPSPSPLRRSGRVPESSDAVYPATIPRRDPTLGLHVWRAQRLSRSYSYVHEHAELEIAVCPSDRGSYLIGEHEYPIAPGQVFIVNAHDRHQPILDREHNDGALVAYFTPDVAAAPGEAGDLLVPFMVAGYVRQNCLADLPRVHELLEELKAAYISDRPYWQMVCRGILAHVLALVGQRYLELAEGQTTSRWGEVRRFDEVLAFINAHLDEPIEGARLYRIAGLSRSQCCARFKAVFGMTMAGYVQRQRMRRAMQLLESTELPVSDIALRCGYAWVGHFNTTFRRHAGCSPTDWRRQRD